MLVTHHYLFFFSFSKAASLISVNQIRWINFHFPVFFWHKHTQCLWHTRAQTFHLEESAAVRWCPRHLLLGALSQAWSVFFAVFPLFFPVLLILLLLPWSSPYTLVCLMFFFCLLFLNWRLFFGASYETLYEAQGMDQPAKKRVEKIHFLKQKHNRRPRRGGIYVKQLFSNSQIVKLSLRWRQICVIERHLLGLWVEILKKDQAKKGCLIIQ